MSLQDARANQLSLDWDDYAPPKPRFLGVKVFDDFDLRVLSDYIDWSPFFRTWGLSGRYPDILDDADKGEQARSLYQDAQSMLQQMIDEKWVVAKGVIIVALIFKCFCALF